MWSVNSWLVVQVVSYCWWAKKACTWHQISSKMRPTYKKPGNIAVPLGGYLPQSTSFVTKNVSRRVIRIGTSLWGGLLCQWCGVSSCLGYKTAVVHWDTWNPSEQMGYSPCDLVWILCNRKFSMSTDAGCLTSTARILYEKDLPSCGSTRNRLNWKTSTKSNPVFSF